MDFETQKSFLASKVKTLTDEASALQAILDNLIAGYTAPVASLTPLMTERDSLKLTIDSLTTEKAAIAASASEVLIERDSLAKANADLQAALAAAPAPVVVTDPLI